MDQSLKGNLSKKQRINEVNLNSMSPSNAYHTLEALKNAEYDNIVFRI
jgi:hypothetical protein